MLKTEKNVFGDAAYVSVERKRKEALQTKIINILRETILQQERSGLFNKYFLFVHEITITLEQNYACIVKSSNKLVHEGFLP